MKVLIRLLKARLKVLLKVLVRLLKARQKVLLKVLIRLLKARLKVLLKVLIRLLLSVDRSVGHSAIPLWNCTAARLGKMCRPMCSSFSSPLEKFRFKSLTHAENEGFYIVEGSV